MQSGSSATPESASHAHFATTRWSMVLAAGHRSAHASVAALEALCRAYWYPLYAYARRRGHAAHDAADLTQDFFASLLERESLRSADPERGRFRSFLLTCFKRFLVNAHEHRQARKRGGGALLVPIDVARGEERYQREPVDHRTPEAIYERRWALMLLEQVMLALEQEYSSRGRLAFFNCCKPHLAVAPEALPYAQLAVQLGISESAARVGVHRLRRRYAELLRAAVAATLDEDQDPKEEIQRLILALGRNGS